MPIYVFQCPACLEIVEEMRPIDERNRPGPECPTEGCQHRCERNLGLEQCNTDVTEWLHPVHSERMAVNPDQVAEHRRRFPNIPLTETGEVIVTSAAEERRINRELRRAFEQDR